MIILLKILAFVTIFITGIAYSILDDFIGSGFELETRDKCGFVLLIILSIIFLILI